MSDTASPQTNLVGQSDEQKPHIHLPDGSCCGPKRFAHLHQHTQYSLLDGAARLQDLMNWVKKTTPEGAEPACAMTDHGNMHGAVHFYNCAQEMGVKPIIGCEAYVVPGYGTRSDRTRNQDGEKGIYHLTLLARDFEGYQNLCRLSSLGYLEGYYYKPRIDHELLEKYSKGVIALSGCLASEVQQLLLRGREDEAKERMEWYRRVFGDNYFVEIQDHGLKEQKHNNPILKTWANELGIGMVATNDGHYVEKADATAHEALLSIQTKTTLADENRFKFPCDEFYVKDLQEMHQALPPEEWGEEIFDNTTVIADLCNVELPVGKNRSYQMPALPIPKDRTMSEELRFKTYSGMMERYADSLKDNLLRDYALRSLVMFNEEEKIALKKRLDCNPIDCETDELLRLLAFIGSVWEQRGKADQAKFTPYPVLDAMEQEAEAGESKHENNALVIFRRAEYELSIINLMQFPDYFLIVADYINWAKEQGISVGPGRGSGAGSLVAYALHITNLDPLEFNLLFERFLNPDRVSMPDFDIDFDDVRRGEVIEYVQKKYGKDKVAQISTFGRMSAKACLRDVGRVMGMDYATIDRVSKLIPVKFGKSYSLEKARQEVPDIRQILGSNEKMQEVYEFSMRLENLTRHASIHAAGVVIGKDDLIKLIPLMRDNKGEGIVCQYDMAALEDIGLIKMDFLGLRTLSFLKEAQRVLKESRNTDVDFDKIDFLDVKTFELLSRGDTKGVFQLDGAGIADASRRLKPRHLKDIIALSALYRPGPLEYIPVYIRRHHGLEDVDYVRDGYPQSAKWLTGILEETYGIPVYQEQIMEIANKVAGYSLGESDILRRLMSKKKNEEMDMQRQIFVDKAQKRGVSPEEGNKLFDLLNKFSDYGFNKSHSAAYGVITYQTAWLKANYPVEFMAALLTVEYKNSNKVAEYINDAHKMKLRVLPPNINLSSANFTVSGDDILFGLSAIKGLGDGAIQSILDERVSGGEFKSLANFCSRVSNKICNKKGVENLIKSGAFDEFGERRQLLESLEETIKWSQGAAEMLNSNMDSLFGIEETAPEPKLKSDVSPLTELERLKFEKIASGLYISGHPLKQYDGLREASSCLISELGNWFEANKEKNGNAKLLLAGMIESVSKKPTKSGSMMARFVLADESGQVEMVCFTRAYERIQSKLIVDTPAIFVTSIRDKGDDGLSISAEEIVTVEDLADIAKVMHISIDLDDATADNISELQDVLEECGGAMPTYLRLETLKQYLIYKLNQGMGSPRAIEIINQRFGWAKAYLAYDQAIILSKFSPKPPEWMSSKNRGAH